MMDTIHRFASVVGRVTNELTGRPIAGATVAVISSPIAFQSMLAGNEFQATRNDIATTSSDGFYYFMNLPNGDYGFRVTAAGAQSFDTKALVTRTPDKVAPPAVVDVLLKFNSTSGEVQAKQLKPRVDRRSKK